MESVHRFVLPRDPAQIGSSGGTVYTHMCLFGTLQYTRLTERKILCVCLIVCV